MGQEELNQAWTPENEKNENQGHLPKSKLLYTSMATLHLPRSATVLKPAKSEVKGKDAMVFGGMSAIQANHISGNCEKRPLPIFLKKTKSKLI